MTNYAKFEVEVYLHNYFYKDDDAILTVILPGGNMQNIIISDYKSGYLYTGILDSLIESEKEFRIKLEAELKHDNGNKFHLSEDVYARIDKKNKIKVYVLDEYRKIKIFKQIYI